MRDPVMAQKLGEPYAGAVDPVKLKNTTILFKRENRAGRMKTDKHYVCTRKNFHKPRIQMQK